MPTSGAPPLDSRTGTAVEYDDLTSKQRSAFEEALEGEVQFVPKTSHVDGQFHYHDRDPFRSREHVQKNGSYYAIDTSAGDRDASYPIDATVGSPDVEENATVVDVERVSTTSATRFAGRSRRGRTPSRPKSGDRSSPNRGRSGTSDTTARSTDWGTLSAITGPRY